MHIPGHYCSPQSKKLNAEKVQTVQVQTLKQSNAAILFDKASTKQNCTFCRLCSEVLHIQHGLTIRKTTSQCFASTGLSSSHYNGMSLLMVGLRCIYKNKTEKLKGQLLLFQLLHYGWTVTSTDVSQNC